jgi:hypothetical protein
MTLHGKIVKGCGAASQPDVSSALPKLLPIIEREYDELCGAHRGTINVDVGRDIDLKIDFKTDRLISDGPKPRMFVHCSLLVASRLPTAYGF